MSDNYEARRDIYVLGVSVRQHTPHGTQDERWKDEWEVAIWGIGEMKENCSNNDNPLGKNKNPFGTDHAR